MLVIKPFLESCLTSTFIGGVEPTTERIERELTDFLWSGFAAQERDNCCIRTWQTTNPSGN